jgi:hypothetical protein
MNWTTNEGKDMQINDVIAGMIHRHADSNATIEKREGDGRPPKPAIDFDWEWITPEIAKEMLDNSIENQRNIIRKFLNQLKTDMENGDFQTTHEPIGIMKDGKLGDGQHRIRSIYETGIPYWLPVARGLTYEALAVIDSGRVRTHAHVLQMAGFTNTTQNSAIATLVYKAEEAWDRNLSLSTVNALSPTKSEKDKVFYRIYSDLDMKEVHSVGAQLAKTRNGRISRTISGAFTYLATRETDGHPIVDEFLEEMQGLKGDRRCAAQVLVDKTDWIRSQRSTPPEWLGWMITAFRRKVDAYNQTRDDHVDKLKWSPRTHLPKIPQVKD